MSSRCASAASGGKGNRGMFIDRNPNICSAGITSAQSTLGVKECLVQYTLQDEVDALISDSIFPDPEPKPLPPLRKPKRLDMRYAGPYCEVAKLINPEIKSKFEGLVEDFRSTVYQSYWKKRLAQTTDPTPMFPDGFDYVNTTFGKKLEYEGSLYDIVMPKHPLPDKTPKSKEPAAQTDRNYCAPPFDKNLTYGIQYRVDPQGRSVKCCLTDERIKLGTHKYMPINTLNAEFRDKTKAKVAVAVTPNENINLVPPGYAFGKLYPPQNLAQSLMTCPLNPAVTHFKKCVGHLNLLKKKMSQRPIKFFEKLYLSLKYEDKEQKGWLPKSKAYEICAKYNVYFDSTLIEPLLCAWNGFDGSNIEYKILVHILNYREPMPDLPKIPYVNDDCMHFTTAYKEMTKPGQELGPYLRAGVPTGRYFDMDFPVTPKHCTKADKSSLPHESDAVSLVSPSIFTLLGVNHRHVYAKQTPEQVRRIFENAGESFTDEKFKALWEKAQELHSQGWVCIETFRQTMMDYPDIVQNNTNEKNDNIGNDPQNSNAV